MQTIEKLAYLAGFVDGEGCVGIKKCAKQNVSRGYSYSTFIIVKNTRKAPLYLLQEIFGGNVSPDAMRSNPNHSSCWAWQRNGPITVGILKALLPYLIIKKPQAELAIDFQEHRIRQTGRGKCKTNSQYQWEDEFYLKARELNRRGNHHEQ